MAQKQSIIRFHSKPLKRASQLAVSIADERSRLMRGENIKDQRERQLEFASARVIPARVHCHPISYSGVPCEWVIGRRNFAQERIILYLHGGSWIFGSMDSARPVGVLLSDVTGFRCLMVDYRLAPEHPFPGGLTDCLSVYKFLLDSGLDPNRIGIFGDSAGGNLALALLHRLQEEGLPLPKAVALASPVTDMGEDSNLLSSKEDLIYIQHEGEERDIFSLYLGDEFAQRRSSPLSSPIKGELKDFPPILIHAGGEEAITVDNIAFINKATQEGVAAEMDIWNGLFHDFTVVGRTLGESRESMKGIGQFFTNKMK